MIKFKQGLILLTSTLLLAFVIPACKKSSKNDGPQEQAGKIPGLGETAGTPTGTDLVLPANVTQVGTIYGDGCDTTYETGSGVYVDVCVAFFNGGTSDVTLTLPGGLCILADDLEYQHGIVLQDTKIILKAGRITRCTLYTYCANAHRDPSYSRATYKIGKVSDSRLVRELVSMLANKKTMRSEYPSSDKYNEAVSSIQSAIWNITDFALPDHTWKSEIQALPNR